ncbi:MFS transporter [Pectinatus sottacetonis]|uniref:MFS transporter n=1 Tax=Pectinatus sottacetonis TaxID=1002795 RepID=UPI0018C72D58|nr:MFS transporter [Pectinatus sottacetonis]
MNKKTSHKWTILAVVTLASFITNVDSTIVIIGLPKLMQDLHLSVDTGLWIITSYVITSTVFLLPAGKWSDMIGKKRIFIGGFTLFTLATILCAIANSGFTIITFRFLQGAGASMALATATPIIMETFEKRQLGLAISINATSWVLGAIIGPVIGGALIDTLGWRSIFTLTIPFAAVGLIMALFLLPSDNSESDAKMDWKGLFYFTGFLTTLMIILSEGYTWGWSSNAIITLAILTLISFLLFIYNEKTAISPLFNINLLKNNQYSIGLLITIGYLTGYYSITLLLTIYLQGALHLDALHAGMLLIPLSLPQLILSPFCGSLVDRIGAKFILILGLIGQTIGLFMLGILPHTLSFTFLSVVLALISTANSLSWPALAKTILGTVPLKESGAASGMFFTINYASRAITQTLVLLFMEITVSASLVTMAMGNNSSISIFEQSSLIDSVNISFRLFALFTLAAALLTFLFLKKPSFK